MSSPLRYDTSQLDGEKMSPVKLPVYPDYRARSSSPIPKGVTRHTPTSKLRYQHEAAVDDNDEFEDEPQTQSKIHLPQDQDKNQVLDREHDDQYRNQLDQEHDDQVRSQLDQEHDGQDRNQLDQEHDRAKDATPSRLVAKHPHGLTAKHESRRNTIHHISTVKDPRQNTPVSQFAKDQKSTSKRHANTISHISFNSSPRIVGLKKHIEATRRKGAALTSGVDLEVPAFDSFGVYSSPTHPPHKRNHRHLKNNAINQRIDENVDLDPTNHSDKENSNVQSLSNSKPLTSAAPALNSSPSRSHNSSYNGQQASSPIRSTINHTRNEITTLPIRSSSHQRSIIADEDDADYGEDKHIAKIARITTNAHDSSASSAEHTKVPSRSAVDDDFFSKHDLVGQISSSRGSTADVVGQNNPVENNAPPQNQGQQFSNIQDESDSEFEEDYVARNDHEPSVSQTMLPTKHLENTNYSVDSGSNKHQPQEISLLRNSGGSHHISRGELGDAAPDVESSPLKNKSDSLHRQHHDHSLREGSDGEEDDDQNLPTQLENNDINLEDEPTTNFMLSPNSKPYFSIAYIKKIQEMHRQEMKESEKIIDDKNKQILSFSKELASTNDQFLSFEQEIKALKQLKKRYIADEESLSIQVNQLQRELASTTKKLRIKENNYIRLETTANQNQMKINQLETAVKENDSALKSYENKHYELNSKINELEFQIKDYEYKLKSHQDEIVAKDKEVRTLTEANLDYNSKVEDLLKEKEELLTENGIFTSEISKLKSSMDDLEQENFEVKEKNTTLQSNVKFQQDEINNLNTEKLRLSSKFDSIVKEVQTYQQEFTKLENDLKATNDELSQSKDLVSDKSARVEELQKEFDAAIQQNEELKSQLTTVLNERDDMISQVKDSHVQIDKLIDDIRQKDSFIKSDSERLEEMMRKLDEKDDIIKSDTNKIDEMVQKLNERDTLRSSSFNEQKYLEKLDEIKLEYHREVERRVDEASKILYNEYSKKHEKRIALIKNSYREKLDRIVNDHRDKVRDYDSVVRKCQVAEAEKEALLKLLEQEKTRKDEPWASGSTFAGASGRRTPTDPRRLPPSSAGSGSYGKKRLSPKKTAGGSIRRKL